MLTSPTPPTVTSQAETPRSRTRQRDSERSAARKDQLRASLADHIVVAEDLDCLNAQANDIHMAFKPRNGWQDWLTSEIAVLMVRINRCERIERRMRDLAAFRAIHFWEDDQKVEVETLALKIHRQAGRTVAKLRLTPAGCDWLLARWKFLASRPPLDWTDAQRELAGKLVGDDPILDPTAPGFAAGQVAELERQRERVVEADDAARGLVEADLSDDIPSLSRIRRYSRSLYRQMKYYIDQFYVEHPDRWDDPNRKPAFIAQAFIDRDRKRESAWHFNPPTAPAPASAEHQNAETNPLLPEPEPRNAGTKPLKPMHQMTADELEANFPPETFVCQGYHNEKIKVVDRPKRVDHVRDANQRGKLAKRRAALAKLGI